MAANTCRARPSQEIWSCGWWKGCGQSAPLCLQVVDLDTSACLFEVSHNSSLSWLALGGRGDCLLARDANQQLLLFDIRGAHPRTKVVE
jgi:hypothetical protein